MLTEMFSIRNNVALVTGASRGLGYAMAEALGNAGAHLIINGRNVDKLESAAAGLRNAGIVVDTAAFDVSDHKSARQAVSDIIATHGRLDTIILNAGIQHRAPLLEWKTEQFERIVDTNLTSSFVLAQEAARHMMGRGRGRIIFTASIIGIVGRATIHGYAAAKAGLAGLTKSIAVEVGAHGITCNAICPGFFETEMNSALLNDAEFAERIRARIPLGRWGRPGDIAGAAVFLASPAAAFVTGHMLVVDGGQTIMA